MRAIVFSGFGEADVLVMTERELPQPEARQVRVRVCASGLNPIDFKTRRGLGFVSAHLHDRLPWAPGYDVSGVVEAVGREVFGGGFVAEELRRASRSASAPNRRTPAA